MESPLTFLFKLSDKCGTVFSGVSFWWKIYKNPEITFHLCPCSLRGCRFFLFFFFFKNWKEKKSNPPSSKSSWWCFCFCFFVAEEMLRGKLADKIVRGSAYFNMISFSQLNSNRNPSIPRDTIFFIIFYFHREIKLWINVITKACVW